MSKLFDKAHEAVKKRNYDYAIELFRQELAMDPDNVEAIKALRATELKKFQEAGTNGAGAMAYIVGLGPLFKIGLHKLTRNHEKLILDCEEFLRNAPKSKGILIVEGNADRAAGHVDAAIEIFEEVREIDKTNTVAIRALAQLHREKGEIGKATEYYELLRRYLPADAESTKAIRDLAAMGSSAQIQEKKDKGEGSFRDVIKDRDKASALEADQKILRSERDVTGAIGRVEAELEQKKDDPKLWRKLGDLYEKAKDYERAARAYEEAIKLRPADATYKDALGDLRIREGDEDVAHAAVELKANANDAGLKKSYQDALKAKLKLCIDEYERRVKDHPTELGLRFTYGKYLYQANRVDDAISEFQKSIGDPRRKTHSHMMLGMCFAQKKLPDLAVKELSRAREGLTPQDEAYLEVTYNLAAVLAKGGKKAEAKKEYERIVEVDINYKDVMKRLEELEV